MSYFGQQYGRFSLPIPFKDIEAGRLFSDDALSKDVCIFLDTKSGMAHIGNLSFWRCHNDDTMPKFLSFKFFDEYKEPLLKDNLWENFIEIIRNLMSHSGKLHALTFRSMNPYIFNESPHKRIILASSLNVRAKGLPFSLSDLENKLGLEIVIHPLEEGVNMSELSLFDLTSLSHLFYFISLDQVSEKTCIFYDNHSKAQGCKFILEERLSLKKTRTLTFVAVSAWTDGIFLSAERYSPIFSSFNQTASSQEDTSIIPLILNFQHCFLTKETLNSLKLCLEGRRLYQIRVSEDDKAALETFAAKNPTIMLASEISYDGGEPFKWETLSKGDRKARLQSELEALTGRKKSGKTKKSLSVDEIMRRERQR